MKSKLLRFCDFLIHSINIVSSFSSGSKSEKLLIDGNFIIPTFISGFLEVIFFLLNLKNPPEGMNHLTKE